MKFADPKRMPIDTDKVVNLLRHSNVFKHKIITEVQTYWKYQYNRDWENGLLTYVNEVAFGDLKELISDVGINKHNSRFMNVADLQKAQEAANGVFPDNKNMKTMANSRFTMLDMTDYESDFASWAEMPGEIQFTGIGALMEKEGWGWPMTHSRIEVEELEELPVNSTGRTQREGQETRKAEAEAEEEEEEDDDDDDDDDEDEDEDEEGEGDDEEEEEEDEDEELEDEDVIPPNWRIKENAKEDRFFRHGEGMWNSYNEVELDNFMKLLNIKPIPQW